ncbi:MAG TPA: DUF4214 domain-containing protein [Acidimicrobiales bacterium]|nr:DUF4214 domain-containing protein [Acidimicrobiales bacterium]
MTADISTSGPARPRGARAAVLLLSGAVLAGLLGVPAAASAAPRAGDGGGGGGRYGTALSPRLQVLAEQPAGTPEQRSTRVGLAADGPGSLNQDGNRIYVDVRATSAASVTDAAATAGATVEAVDPTGILATLAVPATRLEALADAAGIVSVREVAEPSVARFDRSDAATATSDVGLAAFAGCPTGTTRSEGDAVMGGPAARSETGADGTGVKVGIISDSYGAAAAKADIARADLPGAGNPCGHTTPVQVLADDYRDGIDEGRAMAQIIHDVAPGAALLFADAGHSSLEMANHIRALRDAGAKVIVDDISWGDEAFYQDAIIAAAVDEVAADGVAYYSSAGNGERKVGGRSVGSYETQAFRPMPCPAVLAEYDSTCHDFNPGSGTAAGNVIGIPKNDTLNLALGWNEPMYGIETDLDLYVLDDATGKVLTSLATDSVRFGQAIEWASVPNPTASTRKVRLVIARYGTDATTVPRFKLELNSYSLALVQWNTPAGGDVMGPTLRGHAAAAGANAIGASDVESHGQALEDFSSTGPASICWEPAHGATPAAPISPCVESLVDFVAPDGVSTSVTRFDPFYGTSAAAPHAAALAALVYDLAPCTTLDGLRTLLAGRADPLAGVPEAAQGEGHLMAAALADVTACSSPGTTPAAPQILSVGPGLVRVRVSTPSGAAGPAIGYRFQTTTPTGTELATEEVSLSGSNGTLEHDIAVSPGAAYRFRVQARAPGWSPWSLSSVVVVPPFPTLTAFENRLGTDFAGRALTDDERQIMTFLITDGYGPENAVLQAASSPEWRPMLDPVTRLFYAYFGRKPDPSGLNYWLTKRRSGTKLDTISSTFAGSNEFKTKYGNLSNNAFVRLVYQNVLGRAGDAGGISFWTKQLDLKKKSRGQVMTGFSESNEHLRRRLGEYTTIDLFFGMLRRIPTADELAQWVPVAVDDEGVTALAKHLVTSQEYADRVS